MKKINIYYILVLSILVFTQVSCNNDDDGPEGPSSEFANQDFQGVIYGEAWTPVSVGLKSSSLIDGRYLHDVRFNEVEVSPRTCALNNPNFHTDFSISVSWISHRPIPDLAVYDFRDSDTINLGASVLYGDSAQLDWHMTFSGKLEILSVDTASKSIEGRMFINDPENDEFNLNGNFSAVHCRF